jgi:hypothetical protein
LIFTIALIAALSAGVYAYVKWSGDTHEANRPFELAAQQARDELAAGKPISLSSESLKATLEASVSALQFPSELALPAGARERIASDVSRALLSRWQAATAEDYVAAKLAAGYRWRDREVLLRESPKIDEESGLPAGSFAAAPVEQSFALAFARAARSSKAQPQGLIDQPLFTRTAVRRVTRADPMPPSLDAHDLQRELIWVGGDLISVRRWFDPPSTLTQLFDRDGSALIAVVGFPAAFEGGRRLVKVQAVWDPAPARWFVHGITYTRCDHRDVVSLEY